MRTLHTDTIIEAVSSLCVQANLDLPKDVRQCLFSCVEKEESPIAKEVFRQLLENSALAKKESLPLCQDTGAAIFFVSLGQDVRIEGMNLRDAINLGVTKGYAQGNLRKSMCDPFTRKNTNNNTPATVHFDIVPGDKLRISFMPKGGGSENMSRVTMLSPSDGWEGIRKFVITRTANAGSNPCPPIIVGIGIGGTFDLAPLLAKKALMREVDDIHQDSSIALLEKELCQDINKLGIGPMGLGGKTTALAVKIAVAPCHIASLPLAVNIQCHSARHKELIL